MSDSFFGFNTTLPGDDDGLDEDSELEYDALNDETFGGAIKGDWENLHENLVQLDRTRGSDDDEDDDDLNDLTGLGSSKNSGDAHRDAFRNDFHSLEQDLLRLGLRNMPNSANYDDCESRITLDPSVWAPPPLAAPPPAQRSVPNTGPGHGGGGLGNMFGVPHPQEQSAFQTPQFPGIFQQQQQQMMNSGPKMCTLEDIERNMRSAPTAPSNGHLNSSQSLMESLFGNPQPAGGGGGGGSLNAPSRLPPGFGPPGGPGQQQQQQPPDPLFPHMGNNSAFGHQFPPHPAQMNHRQGFPPPMSSGPHSPNQYNKRLVMEIQQTHPLLAYNRMNHPGQQPPLLPPPHGPHPMMMGQPPPHGMHPMGPPHPGMHPQMHHNHPPPPHHHHHQQQQHHHPHQHQGMMNGHKRGYSPMRGGAGSRDGNLSLTRQLNGEPADGEVVRDEYRNLMTPRDKQWLIGIQLLQLNTETPYIDDYYYAVYKERRMKGRKENNFHKDNQMNHPFSQPQGHAQLVLQSIGNRNHQQNNRNSVGGGGGSGGNAGGGRDRKMSESSASRNGDGKGGSQGGNGNEQTPRTYTPLQFENSLGKLQCGSVTAPRKIIDMEIMAAEAGSGTGGNGSGGAPGNLEVTAQRKCRQMLLHIETLYRVVLRLEDLKNPTAIEAYALLREKKERERKIALEQQAEREREAAAAAAEGGGAATTKPIVAIAPGGGRLNIDSQGGADDKSRLGEETQEELLRVVVQGLSLEKVVGMMAVRKGRTCLQRAMGQLEMINEAVALAAWQAWCGIVMAVPLALKKDREETEVQLFSFCNVLKRHVATADLKQLQILGQGVEQKAAVLLSTKFGVGAIILMLSRAEDLLVTAKDTINMAERREWNVLLSNLCAAAVVVMEGNKEHQQPLQPTAPQLVQLEKVIAHLLRFPDLVKSQALLKALSAHVVEEL